MALSIVKGCSINTYCNLVLYHLSINTEDEE